MSAEIRSLAGEKIEEPPAANTPLNVIKQLVAEIESGALTVDTIYVLLDKLHPEDSSKLIRESRDSGITCERAVVMLEAHKLDILLRLTATS